MVAADILQVFVAGVVGMCAGATYSRYLRSHVTAVTRLLAMGLGVGILMLLALSDSLGASILGYLTGWFLGYFVGPTSGNPSAAEAPADKEPGELGSRSHQA